ncbi:MAG: M48 family metalloprotease [Candidatus Omnitrophica bacterium]|nr:M48 family metalloprotease [Candidatus Omnitrophota bacterium]
MINYFTFSTLGSLMVYPAHVATDAAISRRYEREADYFGMRHAFHAGYDVEHGTKVFSRLATDEPGYNLLAYTFSTHPKWPERFLRLEKITQELEALFPAEAQALDESPDWEITMPVKPGETIQEALERLSQMEKPQIATPAAA